MKEGTMVDMVRTDAALTAELNDLLQLDHDAVQAYTVAIAAVGSPQLRSSLARFREDHERHIEELVALIRARGGLPVALPHIPTGLFKLAVQKVGTLGSDREILLAFKANERQVRDKYRRHADAPHDPDVAGMLRRAALDEAEHYAWAESELERLGVRQDGILGRGEARFERIHARAADAIEGGERRVMEAAESARRELAQLDERVLGGVGSGVEAAAGAVHRGGRWTAFRGAPGRSVAPAIHRLGDGLDDTAGYLKAADLGTLRRDVERQADLRPLRTVAVALGVGYLVGRLLP
jgi:rubrerythrin